MLGSRLIHPVDWPRLNAERGGAFPLALPHVSFHLDQWNHQALCGSSLERGCDANSAGAVISQISCAGLNFATFRAFGTCPFLLFIGPRLGGHQSIHLPQILLSPQNEVLSVRTLGLIYQVQDMVHSREESLLGLVTCERLCKMVNCHGGEVRV